MLTSWSTSASARKAGPDARPTPHSIPVSTAAFGTVLDANLTTLIKMAILFLFGAGVVKGFAVTISLGIMISLFTAMVFVRWLMVLWLRRTRPKTLFV